MIIFAEQRIEKKLLDSDPNFEQKIKSALALNLAENIEKNLEIEKIDEGHSEIYRTQIVVISEKQIKEIVEIIRSFESYATDYPALHAVEEKLEKLKILFFQ